MKIKRIGINPSLGKNTPIAVQMLGIKNTKPKPPIQPQKQVSEFTESEKVNIETWLAYCNIGIQMLNTGTKALKNLKVLNERNAIFELIDAFKKLGSYFNGNKNYETKQTETEDFLFTFINLSDEEKNRVIRFQESIINKRK